MHDGFRLLRDPLCGSARNGRSAEGPCGSAARYLEKPGAPPGSRAAEREARCNMWIGTMWVAWMLRCMESLFAISAVSPAD
jgi:hypothetical protein